MKHSTMFNSGVCRSIALPKDTTFSLKVFMLGLLFVLWGSGYVGAQVSGLTAEASNQPSNLIPTSNVNTATNGDVDDELGEDCGPFGLKAWTGFVGNSSPSSAHDIGPKNHNNYFGVMPSCPNHKSFWTGGYFGGVPQTVTSTWTLTVPTTASTLAFEYYAVNIDNATTGETSYIKVNGNTVFSVAMTTASNTADYVSGSINLSAFAGQTITLNIGNTEPIGNDIGNVLYGCFQWTCSPCTQAVAIQCPSSITIECGSSLSPLVTGYPTLVGLELCGSTVEVTYSDLIISTSNCGLIISRTWTATIAGGPSASCTQLITQVDTQGPIISGVEPIINVQCLEDVPAPANATAVDNCTTASPVTTFTSQTGELIERCTLSTAFGPGADWALWLPTLASNNLAASANYFFDSNGGYLDQFADGTAHIYGTVYNTNNANQKFVVDLWLKAKRNWAQWSALGRSYKDDLGFAQPNKFLNWDYYELADGFSTLTGAGDFAGSILYVYHMPANYYFGFQIGLGANCKNANYGMSGWFTYSGFFAGAAISGHGDINVDASCEPVFDNDCVHNTSFTHFYRSTDLCGHATVVSQQVIVNDTTAPSFDNCPESLTIECDQPIPAVATGISATDNCIGDVAISYLGEVQEGNACYRTITRTWSATDVCGNRSECTQVITIVDTTAPALIGLPQEEITVECDAVPAPAQVTALDNCQGEVEVTFDSAIIPGNCPGNYTIVRHWSAYDSCENGSFFTQTIHVQDTTAPVFDAYEFYTHIECNEIPSSITATDNCGSVTVEIIYEILNSGGCLGVYHRIYEATDECGNKATAEQYIAIQDNTAPELVGVPADATIECSEVSVGEDGYYFGNGGVVGVDNCGLDVVVTYSEEVIATDDNCPQSFDIIRTWVAIDYCDNESMATQTVHVVDTTAPSIYAPQGYEASCEDELVYAEASAYDNCGVVSIYESSEIVEGDCPQNYDIIRSFYAVDECGNQSATVTQTIQVRDYTAPTFGEENEYFFTYECDEQIPVIQPVATDNCSDVTYSSVDTLSYNSPCYSYFYRVWTATDACGNSSEFYQYILILDNTSPVISGLIEIQKPCDDYEGIFVTATDNCNEVSIDYYDEAASGSCAGKIIRHYTATDVCQNVSEEFIQIITLIDLVAPVIEFESEDLIVQCGDEYSVAAPQFSDNCDEELDIYTEFNSEFDGCVTVEYYSWTAVDHCNNSVTATTVVTIIDTVNPYFTSFPENAIISCDEELPVVVYPTAEDACDSNVDIELAISELPGDCPNERVIYRTFRAYDNCGNQVVETQIISIIDETAPEFAEQEAFFNYECDETIPVIQPVATDNCGEVSYAFEDIEYINTGCYNMILRMWTATDECDNSNYFVQIITIEDTTAPVVNPYTIELSMPCDAIQNEALITATDNCSEVIITYDDVHVSGSCQGKIIRTYHIEDECGNVTEGLYQQIINLIDVVAPTVEVAPMDLTLECGDEIPAYIPVWHDNCAADDELFQTATSSLSFDGCVTTIAQSWFATDNCNNVGSVSRIITIIDTTAPEFDFVPANVNADCSDELVYVAASAEDVCDEDVAVSSQDAIVPGDCPSNYTIVRTFTATDDCGNSATAVQYIYVTDSTAPVFAEQNNQFTYECGTTPAVVTPSASDNCSTFASEYTDGEIWIDGCYSGFTRTWIATDACGNVSAPFYQYISFEDTTDPVLVGCPSDVVLACDDAIPAPAQVSATDLCDDNVTVQFEEFYYGDLPAEGSIADCDLITPARPANNPCVYPYDWAMALFNLPNAHKYYSVSQGNLVQYPNGSIHVTATMNNVLNPSNGWLVDVWFQGGLDWAAWSSQSFPTGFKADCGGEAANHTEWLYFILQASEGAELIGFGGYEGSSLNLVHAPLNQYFGFQLGNGANNYNGADNAFGGWFSYSGLFLVNGQPFGTSQGTIAGAGDFAFELDCCPDYWIVRQWTATDCSGNSTTCSQTITFAGSNPTGQDLGAIQPQQLEVAKADIVLEVFPNPAESMTTFKFKTVVAGKTTLELFDMAGAKVVDVFNTVAEGNSEYSVNVDVRNLSTGVYMFRFNNAGSTEMGKLIISK